MARQGGGSSLSDSWKQGGELASCVDEDTLKQVLREKLTKLRQGDLFMDGLGSECYLTILAEGNFANFLKVVSKTIAGKDKRKRKRMVAALNTERAIIEREIRLHQAENSPAKEPPAESNTPAVTDHMEDEKSASSDAEESAEMPAAEEENPPEPQSSLADSDNNNDTVNTDGDLDDDLDDEEGSSSISHKRLKKKSKKKKKKSKKPRKEKRKLKDEPEEEQMDEEETNVSKKKAAHNSTDEYLRERREFESQRDEVLAHVPEYIKEGFREIGFSKWGKTFLPVIQLSPFDVEPGRVRDQWMAMFENCQKKARPMTLLIFWYGVSWEARSEAYSFVPIKKVHSYEEGVAKGYDKLPAKLVKKIEKGTKLTAIEEQHIAGMEQLKEELERPKEDRILWMTQFREQYENLLDDDASDEDSPVEEEKPKKQKKPAPKVDKKPKKKRKKAEIQEEIPEENQPEPMHVEENQKGADDQALFEDPEVAKARADAEYKAAVEDDVVSDVDKDDDFTHIDSEQDENFEDGSKKKRKRKSGAVGRPPKKSKTEPAKGKQNKKPKVTDQKEKPTLKRGKNKTKKPKEKEKKEPPAKHKSKKNLFDEEQKDFANCEKIFLPVMSDLTVANLTQDVSAALKQLKSLRDKIMIISPPFIRHHGLGALLKDTKKIFSADHPDINKLCKELSKEMKRIYNEKDKLVPDGFEPKTSIETKPAAQESEDSPKEDEESVPQQESMEVEEQQQHEDDIKREEVLFQKSSRAEDDKPPEAKIPNQKPKVENNDKPPELKIPKQKPKVEDNDNIPKPIPDQIAHTPKTEVSKPGRKKFSLKGMFEKPKPTPKSREKGLIPDKSPSAGVRLSSKAQAPSWLTKPIPTDNLNSDQGERTFAMEYFEDAASNFSSSRFDTSNIARALEMAVYEWSKKQSVGGWSSKKYWEKVHDVVAAIAGKNKTGTIVQQIVNGEFATAHDVVCLSRNRLYESFDNS